MVKAKTFREDLYYRLNVVRIRMPALRERGGDLPQIVDFCLQNLVKQRKARVTKVSPEAMAILQRHNWPGNVRELENVIYRSAVIAQGDAILVKDLPLELRAALTPDHAAPASATSAAPFATEPVASTPAVVQEVLTLETALNFVYASLESADGGILGAVEQALISRALAAKPDDLVEVAKILGLTKAALQKKLRDK
jgi:DNA-binding NtrC family response regulator